MVYIYRISALLVLIGILLGWSTFTTNAIAHISESSRTHNIRHLLSKVIGPYICGDTMTVPIIRKKLPKDDNGRQILGRGTPCWWFDGRGLVEIHDTSYDTGTLCRLIVHEFWHVRGYRAPQGQELVVDGEIDPHHSRNPNSIMHSPLIGYWRPCAIFDRRQR